MNKLYYSISEVSEMLSEEQHVLRYWEKEFAGLKPKKNRGGNRVYSPRDVDLLKKIKQLVRDKRLSVKEAREFLTKGLVYQKNSSVPENPVKKTQPSVQLKKEDLKEMKETLARIISYLRS